MTPKQLVLVLAATVGVLALVLMSVDWRPAALQDPARTLGVLNAQGVIRWGENPDRAPFSVFELALFIGVGLAFVLTGVTAWQTRPNRNPGLLLVVAGLLWLAAGVRRSSDPFLFTLGVTLTLMYQPPLLQLALSFPSGVLRSRAERWAVVFFFAAWVVIAVVSWAFFDPRLHITAGQSTSQNLLLLWDCPQLTNAIGDAARVVQVGVGLAIVAVLVSRWRSGSPAYRAAFLPLWLAVIIKTASTVWASLAVVQLTGSLSNEALLWQYPATAMVPLAVLLGLWRYRFARGALSDLMVEIGMAPVSDRLIRALRRSVRDPTLSLWRWSPALAGFVDDDGVPRAVPEDGSGRAAMVLERNGSPVGALVFDEALRDQPQLLAAVQSATSLALDNQNMEQQLRDQLVEVRRSRERIVTAGDARRRELERDLHDGAQQRLVAVSIDLARAQRAPSAGEMKELVEQASHDLAVALAELRELARGVYPPSLRERGLGGSLTALAERSPLPIELEIDLPVRPPPQVELAAYFICAEAVTNAAKHARASNLRIGVKGTDAGVSLHVTDNGIGGASPGSDGGLLGLSDRAAALGGSLTVTSPEGRGTAVAANLPFSADPTEDMP